MGVVGEVDRLSISAWAPAGLGGGYIACGTYAGAIDPSFASSASLELFSVDVQNSKLSVATQCKTPEKFASLAWSYPSRPHPAGLIAGGLNDGTVRVWDAAALLRSPGTTDDENKGVVFGGTNFAKKHESAVRGVCFNVFSPHLLASGGADAKIHIWDLSNPAQGPAIRAPGAQQLASSPSEEVTAIQWNLRVSHILGTGTAAGVLRIWDLNQKRQVISIPSPNSRMRCSGIHWHPEIATQVLTTCNQDNGYGALLWDLRSPAHPILSLNQFASRGVASASWCPQDSDMLLLATREPRNVIVSPSSGQVLCDLQSNTCNFDVQWSPRIPGLYLSSSIDGRLSVKSLLTANSSRSVSVETANALAESFGEMATSFESGLPVKSPRAPGENNAITISRPPKWLRRPVSVSFGTTGRYVTVSSNPEKTVTVSPCQAFQDDLKNAVSGLNSSLNSLAASDPGSAENTCREAARNAKNKDDAMAYEVLACLMQTNAREKVLKCLGYPAPSAAGDGNDNSDSVYGLPMSKPLATPCRPSVPSQEAHAINENHGNATENILGNNVNLTGPAPWDDADESILDDDSSSLLTGNGHRTPAVDMNGKNEKVFEGLSEAAIQDSIRKAVVVGDLKKAVEACMFVDRMSDALIIAQAGGPELWQEAQSLYFEKLEKADNRNVISAVSGPASKMREFIETVDGRSQEAWKEALALILAYVPGEELAAKCTSLGQRLLSHGRIGPSLVCFLCGGNTKMVITTWKGDVAPAENAATASLNRMKALATLVRKVRLVTAAGLLGSGETNFASVCALDDLSGSVLCEFGGLLSYAGEDAAAAMYLSNLDPQVSSVYGTAEDILSRTSTSQTSAYQNNEHVGMNYNEPTYGGSYYEQPSTFSNWNNAPAPSMQSNMNGQSMPPPPSMPSTVAPSSHASRTQTTSAGAYDPSVYDTASSYASTSYAPPAPPAPAPFVQPPTQPTPNAAMPTPPMAVPAMPAPIPSMPAPMPAMPAPMPTMPAAMPAMPAPGDNTVAQTNYASAAPIQSMQTMQPMAPAPPPPPPSDAELPSSYHANARPGQGQNLPPSAEVAGIVAGRNRQANSSGGTGAPGYPPRRSHSSSSSLSSMGTEAAFLDKADTSCVPAEQQVIVKALRGAYSYAAKRSTTVMGRKQIENVNKKLGPLVGGLNKGAVEASIVRLLIEMAEFIEKGKYDSASTVVGRLQKDHWDNNSQWILGLKRLIASVLTGR